MVSLVSLVQVALCQPFTIPPHTVYTHAYIIITCKVGRIVTAFKILKVGSHFMPLNQNQNSFLNSAKVFCTKALYKLNDID